MISRIWRAALSMTRTQIRSLYALAMLGGIVAFCGAGAAIMWFAYDAALANPSWFKLAVEVIRYLFALIAMFALIVAMTVFGAEFFKAKYGGNEIEFGSNEE